MCRMDKKLNIAEINEEDYEGELDPRVQGELESLNSACLEINTIENELEKARKRFQRMRTDCMQKLNNLQQKLGRCVVKSRPYFELLIQLDKAQSAIQKSAVDFQESNGKYLAAKKLVSAAEEKMINDLHEKRPFDAAMQERLNHATMTFTEAEKDKERCEAEHMKRAQECTDIKEKIKNFEKEHPKYIAKARPYFEMKNDLESKLVSEKWNIEDLQTGLTLAKEKYRIALQALESISEEVHEKRRLKLTFELPERTPGVGAEAPDEHLEMNAVSLDMLSDTMSCTSIDSCDSHLHGLGDGASYHGDKLEEAKEEEAEYALIVSTGVDTISITTDDIQNSQPSLEEKPERKPCANGRVSYSADRATFLRMKDDAIDNISMDSCASLEDLSEFNKDVIEISQNTVPVKQSTHKKKMLNRLNAKAAFPILAGLTETNQRYSPKLPRAKVSRVYEQVVVEGGGALVCDWPQSDCHFAEHSRGDTVSRAYSPLTGSTVLTLVQRASSSSLPNIDNGAVRQIPERPQ